MKRWEKLAIAAAVVVAQGCYPFPSWPHLPEAGTCRTFAMTTWGGGAPWSEVDWTQIAIIDEPMDPTWRPDSNLGDPAWVKSEMAKLRDRVAAAKATGKTVWLNWSTEEWNAVASSGEGIGCGADIVSLDSYGGVWDWEIHTRWRLDHMLRMLEPGQMMGVIPEGHYAPDWGVDWPEIDYVQINTLYFDWALRHQNSGRIFAMAPFQWGPCDAPNKCIADMPKLAGLLADLAAKYPRCPTP